MNFMDFVLTQNILNLLKILQKAALNIVMSICLFAWDNSAPNRHTVMNFDLCVFFEILSREYKFDCI